MESLKGMIDKAAKVCGSKSGVARRLGISVNRLWDYESGFRPIPDEKLIELAHIAGMNPIKALGEYAWERHAKKKGAATAGTAAAACFLVALLGGAPNISEAKALKSSDNEYPVRPKILVQLQRLISRARRKVITRLWNLTTRLIATTISGHQIVSEAGSV